MQIVVAGDPVADSGTGLREGLNGAAGAVKIEIHCGVARRRRRTNEGPTLARQALVRFDRTSARLLQVLPAGRGLACARGCAHCCHQRVSVTPLEVFELADGLRRAHDQAELDRLTDRVRVSATRVRGSSAEQHRGQPCPLLQADGSCAAYDSRPLLCRGASSFDADACARIGAAIPTYLQLANAAQAAQEQLDDECSRLSGREQMLELACALLIALEDSSAEARWRQGQPVFDAAAHAWFEGGRLRHW